jgi:hypothetical protein
VTRWLVVLALCWPSFALAATRRVAVVVGNNAGDDPQSSLRYAEADAGKLARVLVELGGVGTDDLFLLQGQRLAQLTDALAAARRRIAALRRDPANRVIVLFYFSGHSDGRALELGGDRWTFGDLKRWLASTEADVRIALVDTCKSGALLTAKGGTLGPAFQIDMIDHLASSGEVLLSSSAANEVSLESSEIGGSFFTHHFVSGLRGAADTSGDGLVTLAEAYQYAYARTISTTGETMAGPQHPGYDYRLAGQGELVLTEVTRPTASIELPSGLDRGLVIDVVRDQVIAEVTSDARRVIALQPGRYAIRVWRGGTVVVGRVAVAASERRAVRWDELSEVPAIASRNKADESAMLRERPAVLVAAGVQHAITFAAAAPSVTAELRLPSGLAVGLTAADRHNTASGYRESSGVVTLGYRRGIRRGALSLSAGLAGGAALVVRDYGATSSSDDLVAMVVAPSGDLVLRLTPKLSAIVEGGVSAWFGSQFSGVPVVPAAWLGLQLDL